MRKIVVFVLVAVVLMLLAGCAAGPNDFIGTAAAKGEPVGFWYGLWHGFISPVTFFISLFSDKVNIYEVHNNGGWYNFGFMLGAMAILGGGGRGAAGRRSKSRQRREPDPSSI